MAVSYRGGELGVLLFLKRKGPVHFTVWAIATRHLPTTRTSGHSEVNRVTFYTPSPASSTREKPREKVRTGLFLD